MRKFRANAESMLLGAAIVLAFGTTLNAAIVSEYVPNANASWGNATTWSTNPTIPNAAGDTAQRTTAFTGNRQLSVNTTSTVGSLLYGPSSPGEMGNFFWHIRITGSASSLIFDEDGLGAGFATLRNSNTTAGANNFILTSSSSTQTDVLADDLHVINNAGTSTAANGGIQLASPLSGSGNITFISDGPVSSTDVASLGSISLHSANTFTGGSLIQKGLVVVITGATPFGNAANVVTLGDSTTAFDAAVLSRNSASPINYAITVDAGTGSRTFGSAAETDYSVSSGNITLNGDLNLRAGTASTTAVQGYSGIISGAGNLTKTGTAIASLSGANIYTGTTTVDSGTLLVTNTHFGGGDYTINSGGTLGGNGTIDASVNLDGGTMSPGTSPGTLTLGALSLIGSVTGVYELDSPSSTSDDLVSVTGGLDLSLLTGITLDVTKIGGGFLADGDYALVEFAGALTPPGGLPGFTYNGPLNVDQTAAITFGTGVVNLTLTTIPEPTAFILFSFGLAGAARFRRRRK